ncbi:MAG: hypothetical protein M3P08_16335 [Thermoproteota archaeon]|nr:hypothetical protein [Thermoproteota archaeon]
MSVSKIISKYHPPGVRVAFTTSFLSPPRAGITYDQLCVGVTCSKDFHRGFYKLGSSTISSNVGGSFVVDRGKWSLTK